MASSDENPLQPDPKAGVEPQSTHLTGNRHRQRADRRPPLPWQFRLLRAGFCYLGPLAPGLFAAQAYKMWFLTRRFPTPAREQRWLATARTEWLETDDHGRLPLYHWGDDAGEAAPRILLIHGWNGRGSQMGGFVKPLLAAGFRVTAFDAPAHGQTAGPDSTNVLRVSAATTEIVRHLGPIHGVVAHSFGAIVMTYSLGQLGLEAKRVACLCSPASMGDIVNNFYNRLHMPPRVQRAFEKQVYSVFGEDIWQRVSPEHQALNLGHIPALLCHDEDDRDVPFEQAERVHKAWPGSRMIKTLGLGHRRILRNKEVIQAVTGFMKEGLE